MIKLQKPLTFPLPNTMFNQVYEQNIIEEMEEYITKEMYSEQVFLVHTCTAALEIAALALDLKPDDEVILPSYTFVATANAFLKCGAKLIFVDVDENMNIDLKSVEEAISDKTKVVIPVHYGGLCCDMDFLIKLSEVHGFHIVEDAAQSIGSLYKEKPLGSLGHLGCISFHHTKNIQTGEGGLLLVNDQSLLAKVRQVIDHGTNRQDFIKGKVEAYTWQCLGGAYRMDPLRCALLKTQWTYIHEVTSKRRRIYDYYVKAFSRKVPEYAYYNGHLFFIVLRFEIDAKTFIKKLKDKGIQVLAHYQPLHESVMGKREGVFLGENKNTKMAHRLYRLPLHHDLTIKDAEYIVKEVKKLL
jgi:dTDP-4-amino-4,6-dideoxygalactose transaminase